MIKMTMEASIKELIDKFHRKMETDEEAKKEVYPLKKVFNINLGSEFYSLRLEEAEVKEFKTELAENADVTMITTPENFQSMIDGTLRPMKAYITKKIKVVGSIQDVMHLKKFF